VILAVIAAVVVAWLFVFPALVFVLDLLLVLALAAAGVATRVLFQRPWVVGAVATDASTDGSAAGRGWSVVGWRASGAAIEVVAAALASGREPVIPRRAGELSPPV
jgi:hypothetical protein